MLVQLCAVRCHGQLCQMALRSQDTPYQQWNPH